MIDNYIVYRFAVIAKPTKSHPKYYQWQTIDAVIFVGDYTGSSAEARALELINKKHLQIKEMIIKDQLIEEKILTQPDYFKEKYFFAKKGIAILAFQRVREFFSDKKSPPMQFPQLTENFFDKVFERAGGIRFPYSMIKDQCIKNADYLIDDCVVELKFLMSDPFDTNKEKIAKLLNGINYTGKIELEKLHSAEASGFENIILKPIRSHVQKAAKQIKSVKNYLNKPDYKGGIIVVNQAATALWNMTKNLLDDAIRRHTRSIDISIAIEVQHKSNGMNTTIDTFFYPESTQIPVINKLRESFYEEFDHAMNQFASGGFITENPLKIAHTKIIDSEKNIYSNFQEPKNPFLSEE